ncbi:uncharacterized protein LOC119519012 isoform X2 [Choloepus didactylus]|uniref:uncharacterized protein LOC119519012 isoform X2 n=1 Tax=Choloepus didactylus TaxID=27675 RepID=UPI0018A09FCE|nr:uncharacterized protein LOC119519012 isoform X2 [Choloepus didactylus]
MSQAMFGPPRQAFTGRGSALPFPSPHCLQDPRTHRATRETEEPLLGGGRCTFAGVAAGRHRCFLPHVVFCFFTVPRTAASQPRALTAGVWRLQVGGKRPPLTSFVGAPSGFYLTGRLFLPLRMCPDGGSGSRGPPRPGQAPTPEAAGSGLPSQGHGPHPGRPPHVPHCPTACPGPASPASVTNGQRAKHSLSACCMQHCEVNMGGLTTTWGSTWLQCWVLVWPGPGACGRGIPFSPSLQDPGIPQETRHPPPVTQDERSTPCGLESSRPPGASVVRFCEMGWGPCEPFQP